MTLSASCGKSLRERMIIIIGRGHGGTRLMSQTLQKSGFFMGRTNESGDMIPPELMYMAARIAGGLVIRTGHHEWDFSRLINSKPDHRFIELVNRYTRQLSKRNGGKVGFKLPETLLALPWIIHMFPEADYIYWTRDIRDAILGGHLTDSLSTFNVQSERSSDTHEKRIESWIYQQKMLDVTPRPNKVIDIKFEDFVLHNETEIERLSSFFGVKLTSTEVDKSFVGEYKKHEQIVPDDILKERGYHTVV